MIRRSEARWILGVLLLVCSAGGAANGEAMRVVALAPSITETLFAIGAGTEIVGVSDMSDFPPAARRIDRVGSYLKPNVEAIVTHRPDVVIAVPSPGNREAVEALASLGLRVEVVEEGPTVSDVLASIERIAVMVGRPAAGRALCDHIRGQIAALQTRLAGAPRVRALMVVGQNPLVAVGDGSILGELLHSAGADNIAAGLGPWPRLSIEFVVRSAPDVIIDSSMGDEAPASLSFYDGLSLAAAQGGRLHPVRIDEVLRPGPRIGEGFERIARLVHPEVFPPAAPGTGAAP